MTKLERNAEKQNAVAVLHSYRVSGLVQRDVVRKFAVQQDHVRNNVALPLPEKPLAAWILRHYTECMYSINKSSKVDRPPLQATRLLDQLRERIRYLHYSIRTEEAYVYWARLFVRASGLRHPREMGQTEVESFLTMLAHERKVSPATHRQALSAILFLYKEVLGQELPWMQNIGRPPERKRIPSVLTRAEVAAIFDFMRGEELLLARLLYGTGLRLTEALSLRVKDVDFARHLIIVREGTCVA